MNIDDLHAKIIEVLQWTAPEDQLNKIKLVFERYKEIIEDNQTKFPKDGFNPEWSEEEMSKFKCDCGYSVQKDRAKVREDDSNVVICPMCRSNIGNLLEDIDS